MWQSDAISVEFLVEFCCPLYHTVSNATFLINIVIIVTITAATAATAAATTTATTTRRGGDL